MTSQHGRSISEYSRADIDRHTRADYYVGRWCLLRNWYIATSKVGAQYTPLTIWENGCGGFTQLDRVRADNLTPLRSHNDRYPMGHKRGKQWLSSFSNDLQSRVYRYIRNRRSHLAPLQLWSRDDKSRFPFDHRIERLRDRRTDNRRGKPRALVIYI